MSPAGKWAPRCPICGGEGERSQGMLALDCTCIACGWHYTSAFARAVLLALSRSAAAVAVLLAVGCTNAGRIDVSAELRDGGDYAYQDGGALELVEPTELTPGDAGAGEDAGEDAGAPDVACEGAELSYSVTLDGRTARVRCEANGERGEAAYDLDGEPGTFACEVAGVRFELWELHRDTVGIDGGRTTELIAEATDAGGEVVELECES